MKKESSAHHLFHPAVQRWFTESFVAPTPAQARGWPPIARGENTLILAPTGSGKTLAAFLFAINDLILHPPKTPVVHTLYLSPLKALAADIERNLQIPLSGIARAARGLGIEIPKISIATRTGDTPQKERQRMVRHPPQLFNTTPESLHLILTSPRAREILRSVRYVIVDEIHVLCPNKRGSFFAILLERLEELTGRPFVRIGLSATQRPLETVALFLGGYDEDGKPRPVTIVDAGMRKDLDVKVISPVDDMAELPHDPTEGPTIWPAIYYRLHELIATHRSTLIFANNRRSVERIAASLNRISGTDLVSAHHGSVSKEKRREIEEELKAGKLPALVATGSLELGIDMGAIDLVCQVESPHSVARGLQRVGRAGHVYRAASVGRLIPKTRADLLETAALARAMHAGEIEPVRIPRFPLDVLAQQVAAMVAVREWDAAALYARIRRAAPYHDLPREAFYSVVEMLAGGYSLGPLRALKPRISWDRANDVLYPLPGTRHLTITNGGAIPDTGQYPVYLEDGKTRIGELDEEFVYERRIGETLILGTGRWRIAEIRADRVIVVPSAERIAQMPFWRGEGLGRDPHFGRYFGEFLRECADRLDSPGFIDWLMEECRLDRAAAENAERYLRAQRDRGSAIPTDREILIDAFKDELGEWRIAILSPFGRAFHLAWRLAITAAFRRRGDEVPLAVHNDSGILLKLGGISPQEATRVIAGIDPAELEGLIVAELEETPLFGLRFRQNAARALLLPRLRPGKRTPLWLQRLRARDLLEIARGFREFPIVVETYREILEDDLPLNELRGLLEEVQAGKVRFVARRGQTPSPFATSLLFDFTAQYLYEWDEPKPVRSAVDRGGIVDLLSGSTTAEVFTPEAIEAMERRLQSLEPGTRARDGTELVELLRRIGDLTEGELSARAEPAAREALPQLIADGRIARIKVAGEERLIAGDELPLYTRLSDEDLFRIVSRYIATHAVTPRQEVMNRYGLDEEALTRIVADAGFIAFASPKEGVCDPRIAEGIRRITLALRRRSVVPAPPARFAAFLLDWQHVTTPVPADGLPEVLVQLSWLHLPLPLWGRVLASRVEGYRPDLLEELLRSGEFVWHGTSGGAVAFVPRAELGMFLSLLPETEGPTEPAERGVLDFLRENGASFLHEIAGGLSLPPSQVAAALWNSIWKGLVTNDSLAPAWAGPPDPRLWRRRGRAGRGWRGGGRWSAFPELAPDEEAIAAARMRLLARFGIVSREVLARERLSLTFGALYPILMRAEWRGEIERGPFVSGISGIQFGLREAAERLHRRLETKALILLNTLDPANPYGTFFPLGAAGVRDYALRRLPGNFLILRDGVPIIAIENRGMSLVPLVALSPEERKEAIALLPGLIDPVASVRKVVVRTWDGREVRGSEAEADLEQVGFMRDDQEMIYYRRY